MSQSIPTFPSVLDQAVHAEVPEVSVVLPCLNERETVGICVAKAVAALEGAHIKGEVIVADNGSTDGSVELARAAGARVVHVDHRGYGNALRGGIQAARGMYVLMADSDDSYEFAHIPRFVEQLRSGSELVMGLSSPTRYSAWLHGDFQIAHINHRFTKRVFHGIIGTDDHQPLAAIFPDQFMVKRRTGCIEIGRRFVK